MSSWVFALLLIELAVVSWIDIKTRRIANSWFLVNLGLAVLFHFTFPADYPLDWTILLFPVGWVIMGFVLFLFGVMGAGDSKFLASLFLAIPIEKQAIMFEKLVYATLVVGLLLLTFKLLRDFKKIRAYALSTYWQGLKESVRTKFSYAPVILLAWILLGLEQWT